MRRVSYRPDKLVDDLAKMFFKTLSHNFREVRHYCWEVPHYFREVRRSCKGVRVPIGVPGFGVGFQWVMGVICLLEMRGEWEEGGERGGVEWGQAREPASQCAHVCQK